MPVRKVQATDQVAKDVESSSGGAGMIGHNGNVIGPIEFVMDEDAKVPDQVGPFYRIAT